MAKESTQHDPVVANSIQPAAPYAQIDCQSPIMGTVRRQRRDMETTCNRDLGLLGDGTVSQAKEIREKAASVSRSVTYGSVLELIAAQQRRCALTGRELIPADASLDHIIPISRGGPDCIENAQIVHKDVNRAKGVMLNAEFIKLCREVVAWATKTKA